MPKGNERNRPKVVSMAAMGDGEIKTLVPEDVINITVRRYPDSSFRMDVGESARTIQERAVIAILLEQFVSDLKKSVVTYPSET